MPTDQGEHEMHCPRLPWPLASLTAAVCPRVPLRGAAPADAQQSTIPDVCPGGEMRGAKGECVPGIDMGEIAPAATVPDMLGRWKVVTPVIVTGAGAHHPAHAPPAADEGGSTWKPRLRTFGGTMRIDGQEGERFWGTLESPYYREDLVGTFTGEGGRFLMVDSDGFHEGVVTAPGQIRYCYRQNQPDLKVVGCGTMTKEP